MHPSATIRSIAIFEGLKGVLVLAAGFGLLSLLHRDLREIAGHMVHHLHLNAASHYPSIFIEAAAKMTDSRLWLIAAGAAGYAAVRFVEAYGLWFARWWAEWFAAIAGGVYIPFEIRSLFHGHHPIYAAIALLINGFIVAVMVGTLMRNYRLRRIAQERIAELEPAKPE